MRFVTAILFFVLSFASHNQAIAITDQSQEQTSVFVSSDPFNIISSASSDFLPIDEDSLTIEETDDDEVFNNHEEYNHSGANHCISYYIPLHKIQHHDAHFGTPSATLTKKLFLFYRVLRM